MISLKDPYNSGIKIDLPEEKKQSFSLTRQVYVSFIEELTKCSARFRPHDYIEPKEAKNLLSAIVRQPAFSSITNSPLEKIWSLFISRIPVCAERKDAVLASSFIREASETALRILVELKNIHILEARPIRDFSLEKEDLRRLHNASLQGNADCTIFAFYQLNDRVITKDLIETSGSNFSSYFHLNYERVLTPKPGDLVVYFETNPKTGELESNHYGIVKGEGQIVSKWGFKYFVMEHKIDQIDPSYGNLAFFYRKKARFAVAHQVVMHLQEAQAKAEDFSHTLTHSPLTITGTYDIFLKFCASCFQKESEEAFTQSIFGLRAVKQLYAEITMQTTAIETENLTKVQLFKRLEEIVSEKAERLPLDFGAYSPSQTT